MPSERTLVSFIIPAKNEEHLLPETLDSIINIIDSRIEYEIIVVDNGSSDNTITIAQDKNARVITQHTGTIGSLRNTGASQAHGNSLVFLDADVSITQEWLAPFLDTIESFKNNPYIITGSRCSTSESAGWISSSWFQQPPVIRHTTHVGTGHMITTKILFNSISGFDESLKTAEDFDFCTRAIKSGASVIGNHQLKVFHKGTPETLSEFFLREVWHGSGDVTTLKTTWNSKVALTSIVFLLAHILALLGIIFLPQSLSLLYISAITILVICSLSAWKKYYFAPIGIIIKNMLLYYIYYWGRSMSVINRIVPFLGHHVPRSGRSRAQKRQSY